MALVALDATGLSITCPYGEASLDLCCVLHGPLLLLHVC